MRIRQALPLRHKRIPQSTPLQYSAPTELTQILGIESYKDSAPTELQTWQSEFKIWLASLSRRPAVGLASEAAPRTSDHE
jgi:hypothetical protein